jgi:hypothetical protein
MRVDCDFLGRVADLDSPGIYLIYCTATRLSYVGSATSTMHQRRLRHMNDLRKGTHHCRALQRDWNRYGSDAFEFRVLERTSRNLLKRETAWIIKLNAEYNRSWPGVQTAIARDENGRIVLLASYRYLDRMSSHRAPKEEFDWLRFLLVCAFMYLVFDLCFGR